MPCEACYSILAAGRRVEGEKDFSRFLDGLRTEIARLNSIIEKFLSVAQSIKPRMEEIKINELISNIVDLFKIIPRDASHRARL